MVYYSIDHTKHNCGCFVFYCNMEKIQAELALFLIEKARVLHLTSLLLSVLLSTIVMSQSAYGNFDSYGKKDDG